MQPLRISILAASLAFGATLHSVAPSFAQSEPSPQPSPQPSVQPARPLGAAPPTAPSPQTSPQPSPSSETAAQTSPSSDALEAARELVDVISEATKTQMISSLTAQVWPSIEQGVRAQNPKIDAAATAELRKEYERLLAEDYDKIMGDAPAIYARLLTAQEMRDLIAFYRSPAGAKALRVMPQATAEISAKSLERLQGLQERVYLAFLNILQKRGLFAN